MKMHYCLLGRKMHKALTQLGRGIAIPEAAHNRSQPVRIRDNLMLAEADHRQPCRLLQLSLDRPNRGKYQHPVPSLRKRHRAAQRYLARAPVDISKIAQNYNIHSGLSLSAIRRLERQQLRI